MFQDAPRKRQTKPQVGPAGGEAKVVPRQNPVQRIAPVPHNDPPSASGPVAQALINFESFREKFDAPHMSFLKNSQTFVGLLQTVQERCVIANNALEELEVTPVHHEQLQAIFIALERLEQSVYAINDYTATRQTKRQHMSNTAFFTFLQHIKREYERLAHKMSEGDAVFSAILPDTLEPSEIATAKKIWKKIAKNNFNMRYSSQVVYPIEDRSKRTTAMQLQALEMTMRLLSTKEGIRLLSEIGEANWPVLLNPANTSYEHFPIRYLNAEDAQLKEGAPSKGSLAQIVVPLYASVSTNLSALENKSSLSYLYKPDHLKFACALNKSCFGLSGMASPEQNMEEDWETERRWREALRLPYNDKMRNSLGRDSTFEYPSGPLFEDMAREKLVAFTSNYAKSLPETSRRSLPTNLDEQEHELAGKLDRYQVNETLPDNMEAEIPSKVAIDWNNITQVTKADMGVMGDVFFLKDNARKSCVIKFTHNPLNSLRQNFASQLIHEFGLMATAPQTVLLGSRHPLVATLITNLANSTEGTPAQTLHDRLRRLDKNYLFIMEMIKGKHDKESSYSLDYNLISMGEALFFDLLIGNHDRFIDVLNVGNFMFVDASFWVFKPPHIACLDQTLNSYSSRHFEELIPPDIGYGGDLKTVRQERNEQEPTARRRFDITHFFKRKQKAKPQHEAPSKKRESDDTNVWEILPSEDESGGELQTVRYKETNERGETKRVFETFTHMRSPEEQLALNPGPKTDSDETNEDTHVWEVIEEQQRRWHLPAERSVYEKFLEHPEEYDEKIALVAQDSITSFERVMKHVIESVLNNTPSKMALDIADRINKRSVVPIEAAYLDRGFLGAALRVTEDPELFSRFQQWDFTGFRREGESVTKKWIRLHYLLAKENGRGKMGEALIRRVPGKKNAFDDRDIDAV